MQTPAYIAKNRHGTFYFRTVIPTSLRDAFPDHKREIKKSLQTNNRRIAITRARLLRVEFDQLIDQMRENSEMRRNRSSSTIELFTLTSKRNPDGTVEETVTLENPTPEETESFNHYVATRNQPNANSIPKKSILISEVIEEYVNWKIQTDDWQQDPKSSANQQGRVRLNLLLQIIGDKQTQEWIKEDSIKILTRPYNTVRLC